MISEPICRQRGCVHYQGIIQPEEAEVSQRPSCEAFPEGIPFEIAYGENLHLESVEGDHGIQFERIGNETP